MIKTDVEKWMDEYYYPGNDKIWAKKKKKEQSTGVNSADFDDEDKKLHITDKW